MLVVVAEAYPAMPPPTKYSIPPVPAIDLFMLIFLGSLRLSVQKMKSSRMLMPVIIVSFENLSTLPLSLPGARNVTTSLFENEVF